MALLDFANMTVPKLLAKQVSTFYDHDALLSKIKAAGKMDLNGGSKIQITLVTQRGSDATQVTPTNLAVPLTRVPVTELIEFNYGRILIPVILPHLDLNRLDQSGRRALVKITTEAVMTFHKMCLMRRIYSGETLTNNPAYKMIGTLNGFKTDGTQLGLSNGAIQFATPASQTGSYLTKTRVRDTTFYTNQWFNQGQAFTGITDMVKTIKNVANLCNLFSPTDSDKVSLIVCSTDTQQDLDNALMFSGGAGMPNIVYTAADAAAGRVLAPITQVAGIPVQSSRWFLDASYTGMVNPMLLLNPRTLQYNSNGGRDFKLGKFVNMLETNMVDADVAVCEAEVQFLNDYILGNGAVWTT